MNKLTWKYRWINSYRGEIKHRTVYPPCSKFLIVCAHDTKPILLHDGKIVGQYKNLKSAKTRAQRMYNASIR